MSDLPDFAQFCEATCIKLWGEPQLRTPKQLRWAGDDAYGARTYDTRKHVWYDRGAQRGGSTLELVAYSKGLPDEKLRGHAFFDMWKALVELGVGAPAPKSKAKSKDGGDKLPPILATYPYHDENGALLSEVVRFDTTDPDARFRQRRPDGKGGWDWSTKGVRKVLFRLPELIAAVKTGQRELLCEGEKDTNTAAKLGYAATTMPGGIGKWLKEYDAFVAGADLVVVSDNDPQLKDKKTGELRFHPDGRPMLPGQDHAAKLAKRLSKVAAHVRTIIFPQKDLTEWVEAGGTREQCDALIDQAPDQVKPREEAPEQPEQPEEEEPIDADAEIERLMGLSDLEYEQQKKGVAKTLGVSVSYLDRLRRAEQANDDDGKQGHAITFPEPEPWPEPVDGAALLNEIATAIRAHVVMPDHCRDACALWVVHSFLTDRFLVSPRLGIRSPTKGCGKTLLLDVLARLVARPLPTASVTPAAIFRVVEAVRPTLLIDEADTFLYDNDELRGVLNGNRKGSTVLRTVGDDHEPRAFSVYTAVAIALIGSLPDTLHDRAVPVDLQRRRPNETITPFRPDRADHLDVLARKAVRWTQDHATAIGDADPAMPPSIINRAADNWRPLLAIADAAGETWGKRGRVAAEASRGAEGDEASRLELLLGDIRDIRDEKDITQIPSGDLVQALVDKEGRPWAEMGKTGKPLTQAKLVRMLKGLRCGIAPKQIRVLHQGGITGGVIEKQVRGYVFADFEEAFERYLPPKGGSKCHSVTNPINTGTSDDSKVSQPEDLVTLSKREKSNNDGRFDTVTLSKGGSGEKTHVRTAKAKSDGIRGTASDPVYTGPPVAVPDQGVDPLDAHGAPRGAARSTSSWRILELVDWYKDQTHRRYNDNTLNTDALDAELRGILGAEVLPEFIETEFKRVIDLVFAV
jgi:putative DNA primase/helicase